MGGFIPVRAVPLFLRAHRRAALLTFLLALVVGGVVALALPRRYVASVDLWLDRGTNAEGALASDAGSARIARNTELMLLTSRDLAARAVDTLGLDRVPGLGQPRDGSLFDVAAARREAIRAVHDRLSVDSEEETYVVRLSFRADTPAVAATVANRIADLYVDDRHGPVGRTREQERLAALVDSTREAMLRSQAAVGAYRQATALIDRDRRQGNARGDVAALDDELAAARSEVAAARTRAAAAADAAAPRLRLLERRARSTSGGDAASATIDRETILQRRRVDRAAARVRAAEARVALLSRLRERMGRAAAGDERIGAELARLRGLAAEAAARNVEAVAALGRESEVKARRDSTAYVISRSSAQDARREPSWWLLALTTLAGAAVAAALVAYVLEMRLKGFRTSAALQNALGTRVLALVPDLSELRRTSASDDRLAVPNYLVDDRKSSFAETFRTLLDALRSGSGRGRPMVVSVSSALPDEGKTTVSLCLARAAALDGVRTVLVDCDVRRPAASRALFPSLDAGLVEVIEGGTELSEALQRDPGSDLMVLGIGSHPQVLATTLDAKAIGPLVERLRQEFDLVICDTPPALALSEARETAALADAALLVVRHRETPKDAVLIAQDMLTRAGARIAGAVLTRVRD